MPTILAIDDKQDNLFSLSALLKNTIPECHIVTALSGRQGIKKAKTENIDAILLDIHMPGMDGFETCRILKSDDETRHIPVIILTAVHTESDSRIKGLELGADAFLTKPVDQFELTAQINAMLRIKHAEDILRRESEMLEQQVEARTTELIKKHDQLIVEIEERRQIEGALRKSEEQYREYFEENISGSYISNKEGQLIICNQEYKRIFGFDNTRHAMDTPIHKTYEDPSERVEFLKRLQKEKRVIGYETKYKKVDGTLVHLIENSSGVFDEEGNLTHIRGFLQDVTEQRILEAQLRQAQTMEIIGTLAGGIAHDFNNILFPIAGHTEILLEDISEESPLRDSLNEIYTGAMRAKNLVKQILTFSRQESSELIEMEMQPIIKEALKLIRSSIPKTIDIKQNINPYCNVIKADPTQIHQIVMNLATNAYHSMEKKGGELKVNLKEVELSSNDLKHSGMKAGSYACLTVTDTGVGMDKKTVKKIFDPFFTTKIESKGTGLGLSVVHGIVKSMGGTIHVYSKPGEGSEFNVYFPVMKNASENQELQMEETIQSGTERILLIDDESAIASIEKIMLERLGYHVSSYTDSIEALEVFRTDPDKFDLVITDLTMPNIPGNKLSNELMKIRSDIPILLCTGFSETITEDKISSLGIKGILMKPITKNDLSRKIRELLDN